MTENTEDKFDFMEIASKLDTHIEENDHSIEAKAGESNGESKESPKAENQTEDGSSEGTDDNDGLLSESDSTEDTGESELSDSEDKEDEDAQEEETEVDEHSTFQIDGEDVSEEQILEWKQGALRQEDYTKKSQELAKITKSAQEREELLGKELLFWSEQTKYNLNQFNNVDWEEAEKDPKQYKQLVDNYQAALSATKEVDKRKDEFFQYVEQQRTEAMKQTAKETVDKLRLEIPQWNDKLYQDLRTFAADELGISREEYNAITAFAPIKAIYMAKQYSDLKKNKPKTTKKVVKKKTPISNKKPQNEQSKRKQRSKEIQQDYFEGKKDGFFENVLDEMYPEREW